MTYEEIANCLLHRPNLSKAVLEHGKNHQRCLDQIAEMGATIKDLETDLLKVSLDFVHLRESAGRASVWPPLDTEYGESDLGKEFTQVSLLHEIRDLLQDIRNNQILD